MRLMRERLGGEGERERERDRALRDEMVHHRVEEISNEVEGGGGDGRE
jgi:hypothetical protein